MHKRRRWIRRGKSIVACAKIALGVVGHRKNFVCPIGRGSRPPPCTRPFQIHSAGGPRGRSNVPSLLGADVETHKHQIPGSENFSETGALVWSGTGVGDTESRMSLSRRLPARDRLHRFPTRKRQSITRCSSAAWHRHAATSEIRSTRDETRRRPRHSRETRLASSSAALSQLTCLGVFPPNGMRL